MSEPQFDLSPAPSEDARSGVGGWVALWLILGLIIVAQLFQYFGRKPAGSKEFLQVSQAYRVSVLSREAARRFGPLGGSSAEALTPFENQVAELVDHRKKNLAAARLYSSIRYEIGKEVPPEDLEILAVDTNPANRAFAELYGSKTLTPERAKELAAKLDRKGFSYRMAEIHGLEKAGDKTARKRLLPDREVFGPFVFGLLAMGAILLGFIFLTLFIVLKMSGKAKPAGHPAGVLTSAQANAYAGAAALFFVFYLVGSVPFALLFGSVLTEEAIGVLAEAVMIAGVFIFLARTRSTLGPSLARLFGPKKRFWGDVGWGLAGFFANIPLFLCCAFAGQDLFSWLPTPEHPVTTKLSVDQSLPTVLLLTMIAAIMAPLFEEVAFRGTILPALAKLFGGPLPGIVATSLIFAAVHPTGIPVWPALAMIGASAAMLVYQRGSLVPAIVFHAAHNLSLMVMTVLVF